MIDSLKTCPFCGGIAAIGTDDIESNPCSYTPYCSKCGISRGTYGSLDNAVKAWNTRDKPNFSKLSELKDKLNKLSFYEVDDCLGYKMIRAEHGYLSKNELVNIFCDVMEIAKRLLLEAEKNVL